VLRCFTRSGLLETNDMEAQRAWLGGFRAAWVEDSGDAVSLDDALARARERRGESLRQLRSHPRAGWGGRMVQSACEAAARA
jgi:hypothetical protein